MELVKRAPPTALPANFTFWDGVYQPVLDFDQDGCYNVPAIDKDGKIAEGLGVNFVSLTSSCRDESDLDNNNVYVRSRCNSNGWCIFLYDYYFEKDVAIPNFADIGIGHRHDWEHIAVWTLHRTPAYVAVSQHGGYEIKAAKDVRWDAETHPKVVYHKDGAQTHCFRFANQGDDKIENHKKVWFRGDLVSYDGFPSGIRDKLFAHNFGDATIAIKDSTFPGNIKKAQPKEVTFDANVDSGLL
ncbi:necrosis inducing protein [Cercophora newfieldiana]|uniref:Necrosis inducing protein n=1 Tax=Cercophora newfieldiana TaxID=92897 RepID=A0AA39Y9L9_9PEZI|nr:necrosis inducing protein [Cercophora newfieldiana]